MQVPEKHVIEAFSRLGFSVIEQGSASLVFADESNMAFFLPVLDGGMMELLFMLEDLQTTEGIMGMERGWTNETWLPALA